MVTQIAPAIPDSVTVSLYAHASYDKAYDYSLGVDDGSARMAYARMLKGPWLFGRLAAQARGFIYVGATGFLIDQDDFREYEFSFLKRKGVAIVCYWCGSDIRSTRLMNELEAATGEPNISTYMGIASPGLATRAWDESRRKVAAVADRYADAMFSNSVDHLSYLERPTEPFLYFLPDDRIGTLDRFASLERPVVVHASTSPAIKGTPLVRAAVAQLRAEGYDFEYVELIGVPNSVVREQLNRAHIVLNQFYGYTPAVFGVESLTAGAVVMMRADEHVERDLAPGSNDAWVVTRHFEVYTNLRRLLDNPESLAPIAAKGLEWAREYATIGGAGPRLRAVLDAVLGGTYQPKVQGS